MRRALAGAGLVGASAAAILLILFAGGGSVGPPAPDGGWGDGGGATEAWSKQSPAHQLTQFGFGYGLAQQGSTVVMFGGGNSAGLISNTAVWNGTDWAQLSPTHAPSARMDMAMAPGPGGTVVLYGGYTTGPVGETWIWNGTDWWQSGNTLPNPLWGAAAVYDSQRGVMVLFGGYVPGYTTGTFEWNGTSWAQNNTAHVPYARAWAAMAYDPIRHVTVMFGGSDGTAHADTWEYDGVDWYYRASVNVPPARQRAAMAWDAGHQTVVLFGGSAANAYPDPLAFNDTWEWNGAGWTQLTISPSPGARSRVRLAPWLDAHLVMFGGVWTGNDDAGVPSLLDTWAYTSARGPLARIVLADAGADAWAVASCDDGGGLYAAPGGSGSCSCASPCGLAGALATAKAALPSATTDTVVKLHAGNYRVTAPVALDATYSGQGGHRLVIQAKAGEKPEVNGTVRLGPWYQDPTNLHVFWASYPGSGVPRQLWVDGRRAQRAKGLIYGVGTTKWTQDGGVPDSGVPGHGFAPGSAVAAAWSDRVGIEGVGTHQWGAFRCPVTEFSAARVKFAEPCWTGSQYHPATTWSAVSWFENARDLLDAPDEWYFDPVAKRVYYYPRPEDSLKTAVVEAPMTEKVLTVTGTASAPAQMIDISGITFEGATWYAPNAATGYASLQGGNYWGGWPNVATTLTQMPGNLTVTGAHSVRFLGCTFRRMGATALEMNLASQGNTVSGCRFDDTSGHGVYLGGVTSAYSDPLSDGGTLDPTQVVASNTITQNYISRAGQEFYDTPGLNVGYTANSTISQNEIRDVPYSGISIGWGWSSTPTIAYNGTVYANKAGYVMRRMNDGAAIYLNGWQTPSTLSNNFVYEQLGSGALLYYDNGVRGFTGGSNVVFSNNAQDPGSPYWIFFNATGDPASGNTSTANWVTSDSVIGATTGNAVSGTAAITYASYAAALATMNASGATTLRDPEIGRNCTASASSVYSGSFAAAYGCDGYAIDGWKSLATDTLPWWQADLGAAYCVSAVEVVGLWSEDQPDTRANFQVLASTSPTMVGATTLGVVGLTPLPYGAILSLEPAACVSARYVRVAKTVAGLMYLSEVLIRGH